MTLEKSEILNFLPHREPFMFVDKVLALTADKSIEAQLHLSPELPFFAGHFPGMPIMPGVLTCEALAQTAGLLIGLSAHEKNATDTPRLFFLASANMKYKTPAKAGETLTLKAYLIKDFQGLAQFKVEAISGRISIAEGTLVLASQENAKQ